MGRFLKGELPITPALLCLVLGNLLDGILTLVHLQFRGASELNPLMAGVYCVSPFTFMGAKIALVHTSILIAMAVPNQMLKRQFLRFGAVLYLVAVAYQCVLFLSAFAS